MAPQSPFGDADVLENVFFDRVAEAEDIEPVHADVFETIPGDQIVVRVPGGRQPQPEAVAVFGTVGAGHAAAEAARRQFFDAADVADRIPSEGRFERISVDAEMVGAFDQIVLDQEVAAAAPAAVRAGIPHPGGQPYAGRFDVDDLVVAENQVVVFGELEVFRKSDAGVVEFFDAQIFDHHPADFVLQMPAEHDAAVVVAGDVDHRGRLELAIGRRRRRVEENAVGGRFNTTPSRSRVAKWLLRK